MDDQNYLAQNKQNLLRLLYAVKNRRHLGSGKLNVGSLDQRLRSLLQLDTVLSEQLAVPPEKYNETIQTRTSGALRSNLEEGRLYYYSPSKCRYVGAWNQEFWINYLEKALSKEHGTQDGGDAVALDVLRGILMDYLPGRIRCKHSPYDPNEMETDRCERCPKSGQCLLFALYQARKTVLDAPFSPNYKWFAQVYNFAEAAVGPGKEHLQATLDSLADRAEITKRCREHNANVLAEELWESIQPQIDEKLKEFIRDFDPELEKDPEEQREFRSMVYSSIHKWITLFPDAEA